MKLQRSFNWIGRRSVTGKMQNKSFSMRIMWGTIWKLGRRHSHLTDTFIKWVKWKWMLSMEQWTELERKISSSPLISTWRGAIWCWWGSHRLFLIVLMGNQSSIQGIIPWCFIFLSVFPLIFLAIIFYSHSLATQKVLRRKPLTYPLIWSFLVIIDI